MFSLGWESCLQALLNLSYTLFPTLGRTSHLQECSALVESLIYKHFSTFLIPWSLQKRPWCWERLKAGGEGDDRGWDGWMASLTQWTWVWVGSGGWWWSGKPGVLQSIGLQSRTQLSNWTELILFVQFCCQSILCDYWNQQHFLGTYLIPSSQ